MDIIQLVTEIITKGFNENLTKLVEEKQDISQFILKTQEDLNEVGRHLVVEALEIIDEAVKNSENRKRKWVVQEKDKPNSLATILGKIQYRSADDKRRGEGK